MCACLATVDSRTTHVGQYSAWLSKVKSEGARAKWFSGGVKRYFTLDFDAQIFSYSHTEDRKKISQPVPFKEIVDAEQLPQSAQSPKGDFAFGFTVITCERTYELFTITYLDAKHWVEGLNAARDIGRGIHRGDRELSATGDAGSGNSQQQGGAARPPPWAPQPVQRRPVPVPPVRAPAAEMASAPAPAPEVVDPFAALDALEELAGPAPEKLGDHYYAGEQQQLDEFKKQQLREARLLVTQGKKPSRSPDTISAAARPAPTVLQQPLPGPTPPESEMLLSGPGIVVEPAAGYGTEYPPVALTASAAPVRLPGPPPAPALAPAPADARAAPVSGSPPGPPLAPAPAPAPADDDWDSNEDDAAPAYNATWSADDHAPLGPPPLPPPPPAAPASGFAAAAEPSDWDDGDAQLPAPQTYAAYGQPLDSCGAPPPPAQTFVKARLPPPPPAPAAGGSELDDLVGELIADDTPEVPAGTSVYVPGMQCTNCDFQVLRISDMVWSNDVDYMFFRNGYPNVQRLQERLQLRAACYAYCCQCSWRSADSRAELADVMDGLRWRMIT